MLLTRVGLLHTNYGWRRDEDGRATNGTDGRVSRTDDGRSVLYLLTD